MDAVPELPILASNKVTVVCVSDTHNGDPSPQIPSGDIFVHAGDLTDFGTFEELEAAYHWISALEHTIKIVVAGNHDFGFDIQHAKFNKDALRLFTSDKARAAGIHYLEHETRVVGQYKATDGIFRPLKVYGNPSQPEFIGKPYAFTYKPDPSEGATQAWLESPTEADGVHIWVMHSPPLHRLDDINDVYKDLGLRGCGVQARRIASAKPLLAIFGHYHFSWGLERVTWLRRGNGPESTRLLTISEERKVARGLPIPVAWNEWDFTQSRTDTDLEVGTHTLFLNAAWKTMDKTSTKHNKPFKITFNLPL